MADTPQGRPGYEAYLKWLSTDASAQKEMAFDRMCWGWAIGTKEFKKALLKEVEINEEDEGKANADTAVRRYDGKSLREANELRWEMLLERGLSAVGKDAKSISEDLKSANWKVMLAALMKQKTSARNAWITQRLNMGTADAVSRYVSEFKNAGKNETADFEELVTKVME